MRMVARIGALAALVSILGACMEATDDPRLTRLHDAVTDRNFAAIERLISTGDDLEQRDQLGATPLIAACSSGQFRIAEVLIAAGANVFATDEFGVTAGRMAWASRVRPDSVEGQARARAIEAMRSKGFPFPAPNSDAVQAAKRAGTWPPIAARQD